MALPNYLAKIKSSGLYRFTFDKSQLPAADAETMRLVIGYSEKGPFNNPVYIDNKQDFINLFGNVNKRLEKKGVFFHRLALQALSAGPILALNLKPFRKLDGGETPASGTMEEVKYVTFNPCDIANLNPIETKPMTVRDLFDRDRFWKIDSDQLAYKINKDLNGSDDVKLNKYINIAATDVKDMSCSIFVRKCHSSAVKSYDVTLRDWYRNLGADVPEYLENYLDANLKDFFLEIYVFRGEFTEALTGEGGPLKNYFNDGALSTEYANSFGEPSDALAALAADENSNFVGLYRGCTLPYFKDQMGAYISIDILFNADKDNHKMIMKLDDSIIEDILDTNEAGHNELTHWANGVSWLNTNEDVNSALKPTYIQGYEYNTITRKSSALQIYNDSINVLTSEKGVYDALTNHVDSEYHYIIDTFATIVSSSALTTKNAIAEVAKTKDNCLAIMNAPSMAELQRGINSFKMSDFEKGQYKGTFALPSEVNGASYCAYYTPLVFADGLVKTTVPSAAMVSNNFMEKWNSRQPYYIVAGPNYGRMDAEGMVGPDYNYSRADLDILEPMGINCMVYVPRKGTFINSNQTAKQTPVSALSKVHVRELVIYLQNEIESMLQSYQWEMNTQTLRDTIKAKADSILERIKNNGGVYAYLNTCDSSNNTPEVIDNEMVILDTAIEPARGAGKMVQRLTIHKTGAISSATN
jgi:hypothetical protein